MKLRNALALGMGGAALALLFVEPSLAQSPTPEVVSAPAAAAPVPNKGDTAWVMISAVLVLLMTVPGLALFYGGLVRTKNMLSILTQVFAIAAVVSLLWVAFGYSMAFTNGGGLNDFVGGFSKVFLKGVDPSTTVATFSNGVVIPEYVYICFQMTFAMITPGLIVGAFAERMKFSALLVFSILWVTLIYFPMAHMVCTGVVRTSSAMRPRLLRPRPTMPRRRPLRLPWTPSTPMPECSSSGAPSTSPAAPSCTSMRASPASWAA